MVVVVLWFLWFLWFSWFSWFSGSSDSCGSRGYLVLLVLVVGYPITLVARSPAIGAACALFPLNIKMSRKEEISSVQDLEKRLSSVSFPFQEVVPQSVIEWFDISARSHGTTRELLLVSALASTSALIGKTTLEVFPSYEEKGNLFFIAVAQSGSGKSPACHHRCIDPIVEHLQANLGKSIVLDETSVNGLFNHFVFGDSVPILCIDEAHSFLTKTSCASKSNQVSLSVEGLCKCFDGDCWYILKGSKGKCSGGSSARAR